MHVREQISTIFEDCGGVNEDSLRLLKKSFSLSEVEVRRIYAELGRIRTEAEECPRSRNEDQDLSDSFSDFELSEDESEECEQTFDAMPKRHKCVSHFPAEYLNGEYIVERYLGQGAFGIVALAYATPKNPKLKAGMKVAIKKINDACRTATHAKRLLRELMILRKLKGHPGIVELLDVKIPPGQDLLDFNEILLVFEYMEGDLTADMKDRSVFYTESQVKSIFKQMLYGLKYMHTANFVHRDLKPQNILVSRGEHGIAAKICDFGLARCTVMPNFDEPILPDSSLYFPKKDVPQKKLNRLSFSPLTTGHVVTRYYRPPEVSLMQQEREFLPAIDVWSVGCILGELLQMIRENCPRPSRRKILLRGMCDDAFSPALRSDDWQRNNSQLLKIFGFCGKPSKDYISQIKNSAMQKWVKSQPPMAPRDLNAIFRYGPPEALELLQRLMIYDPAQRITIEEALAHPWLADVEDVLEELYNHEHHPEIFEFEDRPISVHDLRCFIIDEILIFNEHLREDLETVLYGELME